MFRKLLIKLAQYLDRFRQPYPDELVGSLVRNTASLELTGNQWVEFAPIRGSCGVIKLTGTCLPVFSYLVFDKKIMQFVQMRVEVARPQRITFISTVKSQDTTLDGKVIEVKEAFKEPFLALSQHLYAYFPFTRSDATNPSKFHDFLEQKYVDQTIPAGQDTTSIQSGGAEPQRLSGSFCNDPGRENTH